jgi:delta-1-pyrroline-5-carboxylate synthetase
MKVLKGEKIGTLFHNEANLWECSKEATAREMAVAARDCSRRLQVYFFLETCKLF